MRLWSLDPQYLDRAGLLAVWREGLLAKKVLAGKTIGYKHHPQLIRFREKQGLINNYLFCILEESQKRGYRFDATKVKKSANRAKITVTSGQLHYEFQHLLKKLAKRSPKDYRRLKKTEKIKAHKLFRIIKGGIAGWEKV